MKKVIAKFFIGCLAVCFIHQALALQPQSLQQWLNAWRQQNNIPAAVLTVSIQDKQITNFLSGTTTQRGGHLVTSENVFGVGSITKTFVAATILQLQQEQKIKLNDPLKKWLPQYPKWENVTIKQLLNMTSGIANFSDSEKMTSLLANDKAHYYPPQKFIDIAYQLPILFKPGAGWSYSNTNYYLLGLVIEKVTGHSLAGEFHKRFFKPLHLNHTFYAEDQYPRAVKNLIAHGYFNGKDVTEENPAFSGAGGSMMMSSYDVVTWVQNLMTPGKVLSQASLSQMLDTVATPDNPYRPKNSTYGLGIFGTKMPKLGQTWWYTGVIDGYSTIFIFVPTYKTIIVAQINSWNMPHFDLLFPNQTFIKKVLDLLFS